MVLHTRGGEWARVMIVFLSCLQIKCNLCVFVMQETRSLCICYARNAFVVGSICKKRICCMFVMQETCALVCKKHVWLMCFMQISCIRRVGLASNVFVAKLVFVAFPTHPHCLRRWLFPVEVVITWVTQTLFCLTHATHTNQATHRSAQCWAVCTTTQAKS
jgi:hypothetical protein